jgi:hypothetical protein
VTVIDLMAIVTAARRVATDLRAKDWPALVIDGAAFLQLIAAGAGELFPRSDAPAPTSVAAHMMTTVSLEPATLAARIDQACDRHEGGTAKAGADGAFLRNLITQLLPLILQALTHLPA